MYIGYAQNVKFEYTRVGGKPLDKEPTYNEDGSISWKWASFYEDTLEIKCTLEEECYVGAVTIPTTSKSKCARVRAYVGGKMVGVYTAETGKTISGKITVNIGVTAKEVILRVDMKGAFAFGFYPIMISVCKEDDKPLVWPVPKKAEYGCGTVKLARITCGENKDEVYAADFLAEVLSERFGDIFDENGVEVSLVISDDEKYKLFQSLALDALNNK